MCIIKGYLKVSIAVTGPGDVCPNMDINKDDSDEVESNLLWSSGMHMQPASFTLAVYSAQDLPRSKKKTDLYLSFKLAILVHIHTLFFLYLSLQIPPPPLIFVHQNFPQTW